MMLRTISLALCAGLAIAKPTTSTDYSLDKRQGQEPCAELSDAQTGSLGFVPAELAIACLRSVPLQPTDRLQMQIAGLRQFVEFQSDLDYLESDDFPARLYPSVDLLGGLDTLDERLDNGFYGNEYDFQLDVSRLFSSAYDGHTAYVADIVDVFEFQRVLSGSAYRLISVSQNGSALPQVYAARDSAALAGNADYEPSPISEIDGQNVQEYLNMEAAMTGVYHDPDANFNRLFQRAYAQGRAPGAFAVPAYPYYGSGEDTEITFDNGTTESLQTIAAAVIDLGGLSNAGDFFERCCSGNPIIAGFEQILEQIEQISQTHSSELEEPRNQLKALVGPHIASAGSFEDMLSMPNTGGLVARQADITDGDQSSSDIFIATEDGRLIGSFPESEPDLAVLALTGFDVGFSAANGTLGQIDLQAIEEYQSALQLFLDGANEAGRTRLIIDMRGNAGGLGYLPSQVFRQMFPTAGVPYQGSNLRAHDLLNFAGQTITDFFTTPESVLLEDLRPTVGVFGLDSSQQLDQSNSSFDSWSDFYGPVQVPSIDADFTNIGQTNYTDPTLTAPIDLTSPLSSRSQAFEAENIVLLQDGACASACALFAEFLKTSAPGGPVRQVVVGGRPQQGPMQAVGGIKGGQLGQMVQLGVVLLSGITISPASLSSFRDEFGRETIPEVVEALNRSRTIASVNYRNSIREGDESVTPLQYVYEAAECRIFYTPAMINSQNALWQTVYEVAFGGQDSACVEGSTGHPSAGGGTDYDAASVPENAASSVGLTLSDVSSGGSGGGQGSGGSGGGDRSGDEEDEEEENSAVRAKASVMGLMVALVMYSLM